MMLLCVCCWTAMVVSGVLAQADPPPPQFERLAADVGEVCGAPISRLPSVVRLDRSAFQHRVAAVAGSSRVADISRFYDAAAKEIVIDRETNWERKLARRATEITAIAELLMAHELVHAWQDEHLPRSPLLKLDPLVRQALLEGHAEVMAERLADRRGWATAWKRVREGRKRETNFEAALAGDRYFVYVESRDFLVALHEAEPEISLPVLIERRPPTQREIAYPAEYFDRTNHPKKVDLTWWPSLALETATDELGFVAARSLIRQIGVPISVRPRVEQQFQAARRVRRKDGVWMALAFQSVDAARIVHQHQLTVYGERGIAIRLIDPAPRDGLHAFVAVPRSNRNSPAAESPTLNLHDGAVNVQIGALQNIANQSDIDEWSRQVLSEYCRVTKIPNSAGSRSVDLSAGRAPPRP